MTRLRITVDLWQPYVHGLVADWTPEWPPAPFRLAQALIAGCHRPETDHDAVQAVRALTGLPNPEITVPAAREARLPTTYTHRTGGPMEGTIAPIELKRLLDLPVAGLAASNRTAKPTRLMLLADTRLEFLVDDPDGTVDIDALDRAARLVPYFGRSQDGCDMSVTAVGPDEADPPKSVGRLRIVHGEFAAGTWVPRFDSRGATRGWAPNSCDWMDAQYAAVMGGSSLPTFSPEPYLTRLSYGAPAATEDQSSRHVVIATARPVQNHRIPEFLRALGPLPAGTFPCVVARHREASGQLVGIGMPLGSPQIETLREHADLRAEPPTLAVGALDPRVWEEQATTWCSATPLRAFPDQRVAEYVIGREANETLGAVPDFTWSTSPERPWHRRWSQPADGLRTWWVTLRFDRPVGGPLVLGATKNEGFGLFVPDMVGTSR